MTKRTLLHDNLSTQPILPVKHLNFLLGEACQATEVADGARTVATHAADVLRVDFGLCKIGTMRRAFEC